MGIIDKIKSFFGKEEEQPKLTEEVEELPKIEEEYNKDPRRTEQLEYIGERFTNAPEESRDCITSLGYYEMLRDEKRWRKIPLFWEGLRKWNDGRTDEDVPYCLWGFKFDDEGNMFGCASCCDSLPPFPESVPIDLVPDRIVAEAYRILYERFGEIETHKDTEGKKIPLDLDMIWLKERMSFEWEAIELRQEPLRIVGSPEFKLFDILDRAGIFLRNSNIKSYYAITDDWSGKTLHNIDDITNYSVFEHYLYKTEEGEWETCGLSRSVMVYIGFEMNGKDGFVGIHMHPWGHRGEDMSIMARLSIVKMMAGDEKATAGKSLVVFDIRDPKEELERIEAYRKSAVEKLHKGVELDELEAYSINRQDTIGSYRGMAEMRMKEQRWGDAASDLTEAYRWLKHGVLTNQLDDEGMKVFCDVCYQLGLCYYNRGLYVKAAFYFELAEVDDSKPEYKEHFEDCKKKLHDIRVGGLKETADCETRSNSLLGELLESCFDVLPDELSNLFWVDNVSGENGVIEEKAEIWNLDVKSLLSDKTNVSLFITFRSLGEKSNCIDKSKCRVDNNIIVALSKDGNVGTMTIAVPAFQLSDNNNNNVPQTITVRFALTELMLEEDFNQIQLKATEKNEKKEPLDDVELDSLGSLEEAHYLFIQGKLALYKHLLGDAIFYLMQVYRILTLQWNTENLDKFDRVLFGDCCYMIGFVYTELHQYENSIYYLGIIQDNIRPIAWTVEYINSLTNSKDVRASGFVNYQLRKIQAGKYNELDEQEFKHYHSFLKRRYGYILIDQERIKEAKEYLTGLSDDPDCGEFAKGELKYISENYPDA